MPAPSWAMPEPAAPSPGHTDHAMDHGHGSGSTGENNN
jgi:hypothetical protein